MTNRVVGRQPAGDPVEQPAGDVVRAVAVRGVEQPVALGYVQLGGIPAVGGDPFGLPRHQRP